MAMKNALMNNMEGREAVSRAVICALKARPNMTMDDLILCCRPYTWNQVFLALDDLIRNGIVTLKQGEGDSIWCRYPSHREAGTKIGKWWPKAVHISPTHQPGI